MRESKRKPIRKSLKYATSYDPLLLLSSSFFFLFYLFITGKVTIARVGFEFKVLGAAQVLDHLVKQHLVVLVAWTQALLV